MSKVRPILTIGKIGNVDKTLVINNKKIVNCFLFYRFQFPELEPDSFFKLLGGERLIVGERAEEFVNPGNYDYQYNQAE